MKLKNLFIMIMGLLLLLVAGCSMEEAAIVEADLMGQETADVQTRDGGYFKLDGEVVKSVGTGYRDVATSSTDLYLLYKSSTSDTSYLYKYALSNPNSLIKYWKGTLDYVDYVDDDWGLLAVDATTYNEIIIDYGTRGNRFIPIPIALGSPSGNIALDITGKAMSSDKLYICFTYTNWNLNTLVSYAMTGTYTLSTNTMSWNSSVKNLGHDSQGLSLENDWNFYTSAKTSSSGSSFYKRYGVYGTPVEENLGSYTAHAFTDFNGAFTPIYTISFDVTDYSYDYFYILTNNNSGQRRLVRIRKSNIQF